jgi:hypothetical protein
VGRANWVCTDINEWNILEAAGIGHWSHRLNTGTAAMTKVRKTRAKGREGTGRRHLGEDAFKTGGVHVMCCRA